MPCPNLAQLQADLQTTVNELNTNAAERSILMAEKMLIEYEITLCMQQNSGQQIMAVEASEKPSTPILDCQEMRRLLKVAMREIKK